MSDMRAVCAAIASKYANMPPPADWPCFGDDIIFTDEMNGKRYRGTILRFHDWSPVGATTRAIWVVDVHTSLDTGERATGKNEWSVKKSEIESIIRKEKTDAGN